MALSVQTATGEIFGYLQLAFLAGIALGPVLAGYIFDVTGAYTWAFVPGIALVLLAALAVSLVRVPLGEVTEVLSAETTAVRKSVLNCVDKTIFLE